MGIPFACHALMLTEEPKKAMLLRLMLSGRLRSDCCETIIWEGAAGALGLPGRPFME